jgi:SPP1 family predicted phage head-tail adaptor
MKAGKLDRQITIERETETVSPAGTVTTAWTIIATVRAGIVTQSTEEFLAAFGEQETAALVFRVRWLPSVEITTQDRVTYAGDAFDVKEIQEIGRKRGLELRCTRRAS